MLVRNERYISNRQNGGNIYNVKRENITDRQMRMTVEVADSEDVSAMNGDGSSHVVNIVY